GDDSWQDFLPDQRPTPDLVVTGLRDSVSRSKWLAEALSDLSPRERVIIERRRLVDDGATLEELGRELGVSKERVRQLESRAMNKLRVSMMRNVSSPDELFIED
ncbi:MAG: sigma-70 family RNA polymerase sigma factor, partial [Gammaproteobacteria bacterium]|nr:sigma-70 family RNA polymerase sigma factor [Gammaproteobacteria bacterium]